MVGVYFVKVFCFIIIVIVVYDCINIIMLLLQNAGFIVENMSHTLQVNKNGILTITFKCKVITTARIPP